jgi:hypothetical protein
MDRLSDYTFGRVTVGGRVMERDLILFEEKVLYPWVRKEGHRLLPEDLRWVFEQHPDILIVGTGAFGSLHIPQQTIDQITAEEITLLKFKTGKAVEEYTRLVRTGKHVACCLHLTC